MDEILDHFFNSTSWTDVDVKERSSLDCFELPPTNEMCLSSIGVGKVDDDSNNSATNVTNSNQSIESIVLQSANPSIGHDFESDAQHNGNNCTMDFSNDQICLQYDMDGNIVTSVSCLAPHNVGCECYDQSVFQGLNGEFETPSMVWPHQAYEGVSSSLCPPSIYESSDLVTAETVKQEMGNHHLPSFASAPQIPMTMIGMQSFQQTTLANPSAEYNGPRKPRVRARRGQATDPHSIAERLRREKIADRMKNLQELVPKSNKTDKASMLDEIIEYVKCLQQEVKVLSARRSGAKGEVMLDNRAKGTNGISDSPSIGHDISFNEIAFEQVLKLMETDVTKAMQYLQSKGLCMMSLSLANTILAEKESSPSADSVENLKNVAGFPDDGLLHKPSSSGSSNSATLPGSD